MWEALAFLGAAALVAGSAIFAFNAFAAAQGNRRTRYHSEELYDAALCSHPSHRSERDRKVGPFPELYVDRRPADLDGNRFGPKGAA